MPTLKGNFGRLAMKTPRDRNGIFNPKFVKKGQTRLTQFDDQILSLYAKGMATRDIVATFKEMYDADVSHSLISKITDSVLEKVYAWQNRPLDDVYPIFDYPMEIRRIIYTTNAIESLNSVIRNRKIFPNDTSACKIIYLAIMSALKRWSMPLRNCKSVMNRFAIEPEGRFHV